MIKHCFKNAGIETFVCSGHSSVVEVKCEELGDSLSYEEDDSMTFETFVKQEMEVAEVCQCFCFVVHALSKQSEVFCHSFRIFIYLLTRKMA